MNFRNKPLDQTDRFHLKAASGWLGLGDLDSAENELIQISPAMQEHPAVLLAKCEVYHAAQKWETLLSVTEALIQQMPRLDFVWVHRSFALHELRRTQEAFDALLPAAEKFPSRWLIRYNLACYCSQLGRREASLLWLRQAFELGGKDEIKTLALEDSDFAPLRNELKEL